MSRSKDFIEFIERINYRSRRAILILLDTFIILLSAFFSNWFLNEANNILNYTNYQVFWIYIASLLVGIPLYIISGQYKGITKYTNRFYFYILILTLTQSMLKAQSKQKQTLL